MPTKNPRVNVTFEPNMMKIVISLAKQEHKSLAKLTQELILEALERREDSALSAIAAARDTKKTKTVKHDDAWK